MVFNYTDNQLNHLNQDFAIYIIIFLTRKKPTSLLRIGFLVYLIKKFVFT